MLHIPAFLSALSGYAIECKREKERRREIETKNKFR